MTITAPVGRDYPAQIATGEHFHCHNKDNEDNEDGEDGHCHNESEDNIRLDEPFSSAYFQPFLTSLIDFRCTGCSFSSFRCFDDRDCLSPLDWWL